jgi:hypothetical protein
VADAGNDRIQVFDLTTPRTPYEFVEPTATIATPAPDHLVDGLRAADAGSLRHPGPGARRRRPGHVVPALRHLHRRLIAERAARLRAAWPGQARATAT